VVKEVKVKKPQRLVMNVGNTAYDIISKVASKDKWFRLKHMEEDQEGRVIKGEGG
jgi:hypothetical protein